MVKKGKVLGWKKRCAGECAWREEIGPGRWFAEQLEFSTLTAEEDEKSLVGHQQFKQLLLSGFTWLRPGERVRSGRGSKLRIGLCRSSHAKTADFTCCSPAKFFRPAPQRQLRHLRQSGRWFCKEAIVERSFPRHWLR